MAVISFPRAMISSSVLIIFLTVAFSRSAMAVLNADGTSTHYFHFKVHYTNVTRLCKTKPLIAVNGEFPGPTLYVRQGDRVYVEVTNRVTTDLTIHWHGVRQLMSGWSDGPAYITQCPIQAGDSFTYNFTVVREMGTLFWHAHLRWLRATLYGAFIILPRKDALYPFPKQPHKEFPIILGEWWNQDPLDVERQALADGAGYNYSDALTINGQPGFLYSCSREDATILHVERGKTYLLRIINAALNFQLFFQIAHHKLTVVQTDACLSKPYTTTIIVLAPGQTADVLITADQSVGNYYAAASVYSPAPFDRIPFPTVATTALFRYDGANHLGIDKPKLAAFPRPDDSNYALSYVRNLRSLNSKQHPTSVPKGLDHNFLFTVGLSIAECPRGTICKGPFGQKISASISNITFKVPEISILQAYYEEEHAEFSRQTLPYEPDFPGQPLNPYNYTGVDLENNYAEFGTKVKVVEMNSNVQLVLQNTRTFAFESHPIHLHGYNFYVVGMGKGNYNAEKDPAKFNLVDPPAMNTVAVPAGGWAAIRFFTDNPGVWLMHCHFEIHTSWGMEMVWIVKDGEAPDQKLPPPPKDYPKCQLATRVLGNSH